MLTKKHKVLCSSLRTVEEELAVLEIPAMVKQETQRREITAEIRVERLAVLAEVPEEPAGVREEPEATQEVQEELVVIPADREEMQVAPVAIREPEEELVEPMEGTLEAPEEPAARPFSKQLEIKKIFGV